MAGALFSRFSGRLQQRHEVLHLRMYEYMTASSMPLRGKRIVSSVPLFSAIGSLPRKIHENTAKIFYRSRITKRVQLPFARVNGLTSLRIVVLPFCVEAQ